MTPIAWMGGSRPRTLLELSLAERKLVTNLFRSQVYIWQDFWSGPVPTDVCRILMEACPL